MARRHGLPVIVGKGYLEETLRAAGVHTCAALVSVNSSDGVNLETALHARALREDLRIVLRLNDDDFAQRVQTAIGNTVSRSVSYLAASSFAAAMLEHQVLRTVAVGRHVLLIAELLIEPGAKLSGRPAGDAEGEGQARVLAVQPRGQADAIWSPPRDRTLVPGDRMIIIATRAGLRALWTASVAEPEPPAD
jgi:Trk K+ transport system NAD-binding subunit